MKHKLAKLNSRDSLKLIYQWIKTGTISFREFEELYPYIEKGECESCGGERGVPGNENIIDGRILCDYCSVSYLR